MPETNLNSEFDFVLEHHRKTAFRRNWGHLVPNALYAKANIAQRAFVGKIEINLRELLLQNISQEQRNGLVRISELLQRSYGKNRESTSKIFGRTVPSGGAFYPNEIYCIFPRENIFLERAFIAHYLVENNSLELLTILAPDLELRVVDLTLVFTTMPLKAFKKYGHRCWRFSQIDLGHLLASTQLIAESLDYELVASDDTAFSVFNDQLGFSQPGFSGEHIAVILSLREHIFEVDKKKASKISRAKCLPIFTKAPNLTLALPNPDLHEHISLGELTKKSEKFFTKSAALNTAWLANEHSKCSILQDELFNLQNLRRSPERFYKLPQKNEQHVESLISQFKDFPCWQGAAASPPTLPTILPIIVTNGLQKFSDGFYLFSSAELAHTLQGTVPIDCDQYTPTHFENLNAYLLKPYSKNEFQKLLKIETYFEASALVLLFGDFSHLKMHPENYPQLLWRCGIFGQHLTLFANKLGLAARGFGGGWDDYLNIAILQQQAGPYRHLISYAVGGGGTEFESSLFVPQSISQKPK